MSWRGDVLAFCNWQNSLFAHILISLDKTTNVTVRKALYDYIVSDDFLLFNATLFNINAGIFPVSLKGAVFNFRSPNYVRQQNMFFPTIIRKMFFDLNCNNTQEMKENIDLVKEFLFDHHGLPKRGKIMRDGFIQSEFRATKTADYNKYFMSMLCAVLIMLKVYMGDSDFKQAFNTSFTNAVGEICDLKKDMDEVLINLNHPSIITNLNRTCADKVETFGQCSAELKKHMTSNIYFDYYKKFISKYPNGEADVSTINNVGLDCGINCTYGVYAGMYGHAADNISVFRQVWDYLFNDKPYTNIMSQVSSVSAVVRDFVNGMKTWMNLSKGQPEITESRLNDIVNTRLNGILTSLTNKSNNIQNHYLSICPTIGASWDSEALLRGLAFRPNCVDSFRDLMKKYDTRFQTLSTLSDPVHYTRILGYYMANRQMVRATSNDMSLDTERTAIQMLETGFTNVSNILQGTPRSYLVLLLAEMYLAFIQNKSLRNIGNRFFQEVAKDIDDDGYIISESTLTAADLSGNTFNYVENTFKFLTMSISVLGLLRYSGFIYMPPEPFKTKFEKALSRTFEAPGEGNTLFNWNGPPISKPANPFDPYYMQFYFQRRNYLYGLWKYSKSVVDAKLSSFSGTTDAEKVNKFLDRLAPMAERNLASYKSSTQTVDISGNLKHEFIMPLNQYNYLFKSGSEQYYRTWYGTGLQLITFPFRDELYDAVKYWRTAKLYIYSPLKEGDDVVSAAQSIENESACKQGGQFCDYSQSTSGGSTQPTYYYTCSLNANTPKANTRIGILPAVPDWLSALSIKDRTNPLAEKDKDLVRQWLEEQDMCASAESLLQAIREQMLT